MKTDGLDNGSSIWHCLIKAFARQEQKYILTILNYYENINTPLTVFIA